jgi:hypothetical protein
MKLKTLFSVTAACGLIAGAAYAQSATGAVGANATDNTTPPASSNASGADMSNGAATSSGVAPSTGAAMGAGADVSGQAGATAPGAGDMGGANNSVSATSATTYGRGASATVQTLTNGPVPDTPENRAKYGGPMSRAGRHTAARGN